ncbi:type II secretion system major pseudopilin GspG [Novosphingobium sp. MW5]|nr:type II secretion system major pseudopilin GspG [Novosphingobium sp. MW5]
MMKNNNKTLRDGFTLIELIVVLAIIGLIMALIAPKMIGQFEKSKAVTATAQLRSLEAALSSMRLDIGRYPTSVEGLDLLQRPSPDVSNTWQGPYLASDVPKDPWGNPYFYREPPKGEITPVIGTLGSDHQEGGEGPARDIFIGQSNESSR